MRLNPQFVIASGAKQSSATRTALDCFALLAMTSAGGGWVADDKALGGAN